MAGTRLRLRGDRGDDGLRAAHGATAFLLSISPDNAASLAIAAKLGFTRIGEQMDEVDGLEWVFRLG